MIKLIGIDLDDTLLDTNKIISIENKNAISYAISKGVHVVIATGRPFFRIKNYLHELKLDNHDSFVISYNGGIITDGTGEALYKRFLFNKDEKDEIIEKVKSLNLHFTVYKDNDIYTEEVLPFIVKQKVFNGITFIHKNMNELKELEYSNKIIICEYEDVIEKNRSKVEELLKDKCMILRSTSIYLELLPLGVSKGNALKFVEEYLNIDSIDTMAIGDEENDLPMFKYAKYKVTMKNSNKVLINNATYVTTSQNESGVGKAIDKFLK